MNPDLKKAFNITFGVLAALMVVQGIIIAIFFIVMHLSGKL
mgnify:CR=1 FL=1